MSITKISPSVVDFDSALVVSPTLTIGDATAEDTKIVFDGNAQDYYIGLDDSADDLIIGRGSTVGTTPTMIITSSTHNHVVIGDSSVTDITPQWATGAVLEIHDSGSSNTANIIMSNDTTTNGGSVGGLVWANRNNSNAGASTNQAIGAIVTKVATDDSNSGDDCGGKLFFYTKGLAGSLTERLQLNDVGNVSIADGNLIVANGHGIDFSATTNNAGASSHLLDDYEEGTWTPGIQATTGNSIESGTTSGRYIKIGKQVIATIFLNNHANNTFGSGNLAFTNLPFTCVNANAQTSPTPIMTRYIDPPSGAFQLHTYVGGGETIAYLYWATTGNWAIASGNDVNTDGSWAVYASCIYEAA